MRRLKQVKAMLGVATLFRSGTGHYDNSKPVPVHWSSGGEMEKALKFKNKNYLTSKLSVSGIVGKIV